MVNDQRKQELRSMRYGTLQRQPEFKHYIETYITSESRLFNEVEYILNKSYEDNEAPYSWDDVENMVTYDYEDAMRCLIAEVKEEDAEVRQEVFERANDEYNRRIKTVGDFEVFLKSLDTDELKSFIEDSIELSISIEDFERHAEVLQWFIMDSRIIDQLNERDQVTLNGFVWGRQSCGQAIEMDGVIIQIFKEWYLELYGLPEFEEVQE